MQLNRVTQHNRTIPRDDVSACLPSLSITSDKSRIINIQQPCSLSLPALLFFFLLTRCTYYLKGPLTWLAGWRFFFFWWLVQPSVLAVMRDPYANCEPRFTDVLVHEARSVIRRARRPSIHSSRFAIKIRLARLSWIILSNVTKLISSLVKESSFACRVI